MSLRRTASMLLDTYVGNRAGERILGGQIRRGHAETMHAAIWLSDLRGFTALSDRLSPETVVEILNLYFDCQVPAIRKHGGEILKFMGDGLLAVFPVAEDDSNIARGLRPRPGSRAPSPRQRRGVALFERRGRRAFPVWCRVACRAISCSAISAAATGSISPASVQPSILRRGWKRLPASFTASSLHPSGIHPGFATAAGLDLGEFPIAGLLESRARLRLDG